MDKEELDELYQSIVLDHSKRPRNFGKLDCSCHSKGKNPSCGDTIDLYVIQKEGVINDIKFQGEGCALSIASTSILTEIMKGKSLEQSLLKTENFINFIVKDEPIEDDKLNIFSGVKMFPLRVKCVLLGWRAFDDILKRLKNGN